jgi:hypothetical protein
MMATVGQLDDTLIAPPSMHTVGFEPTTICLASSRSSRLELRVRMPLPGVEPGSRSLENCYAILYTTEAKVRDGIRTHINQFGRLAPDH